MSTLEKLQNNCRLCLNAETDSNELDSSDSKSFIPINASSLHEKMSTVFSFALDEIDQLPKNVCRQCCSIVGEFHEFSTKVRQNQSYLRTLVGECDDLKLEPDQWIDYVRKNDIDVETIEIKSELEKDKDTIVCTSEQENIDEDDGGGSDNNYSEEDVKWKSVDDSEYEEEKVVVRAKRKYTRRAPLKPKKLKKEGRHDPSKEYRSKPKEEVEEEDRKILEYFKFICELCQLPTDTFIDLRKHFREQHGQKGYHRCCNKKLFKRCHLLEHIQVHLNPHLYGCEMCSKSFSSKEYLQLHNMQCHAEQVERPFKCDKCPKSFIQKGQLSSHMGRHQMYQCSKCDKVLAGKGSLSAHMVNMHSDEGKHICDTCGREFKTKQCFDNHVRKHMGMLEDTSIECEVCHVILHNKATLKKHMIAKHIKTDDVFICNICNKQAPNKFALESHKRKVHCEEKYQCEFCDKRFKNPVTLKEHRASHTGEILYTCPFCATTFNSKANMYAHRKKVHPCEWAQEKQSRSKNQSQQSKQTPESQLSNSRKDLVQVCVKLVRTQ
ncbi:transcription factor grauzone-like isoform X2 [Armigeres subalbatus]|uniref:transcription factor grauzone-like isoform X2 n=1 Tax=Armigeres subalbatus TaxID=124917 RepID=UPI002ED4C7DE